MKKLTKQEETLVNLMVIVEEKTKDNRNKKRS